jgi:REP element-mobilizing transposase RayT
MRKCYLVSTDHLEEGLWFRDDEDFITGMNYVAIQAARGRVTVLAFILMSNHLHFVVNGRWEDVKAFIDALKCRYSRYLRSKYGEKEFLRRNRVDIQEVEDVEDAVRRVIAYVQMNSVAANICLTPSQYPWGTGDVFFCSTPRTGTRIDQPDELFLEYLVQGAKASGKCLPASAFLQGPDYSGCPAGSIQDDVWQKAFWRPGFR